MRKIFRLLMIMAMLPFMAMSLHAEDVVLRFTASTQYADYHEFSIVKVENLTRNWQHELIYPDTVLVLHTPHGIEEMEGIGNALALAGPNPFKGSTFADLMLSEGGNVELKALQIDGKLVARYEGSLPKGTHRITFHANSPQVYLLVANTPQGCLVTKLMNIGYGMDNSIDVNMLSESVDRDFSKSRFIGTFMLGDNMRYTAYDNGIASNAITQHQSHSEDITLQFMVQGTVLPKVRTDNFTNIGATTVTTNGEVYSDGGETVTERGFCWSTQPNPTINDNRVVCGSGLGVFSADITDLIPNTTYYFRAYAINAVGTAYGLEKVLVTFVALPKVITNNVTDIESTSATANGEVISDGGSEVTERGFCWATHENPTIDDNFIVCGSGLGTFSDIMTNLEPNTVYYVRAYAINSVDIMYGNQKSFETLLPLAEVITTEVTDIGSTTATGNGEVVSDGGMTVTERGVCWSTSQYPTINGSHVASGSGLGVFDAAMTGLSPNTTYHVRAYAINAMGVAYGNEVSFTTEAVLAEVITNEVTGISFDVATGNGEVVSDGGMTVTERGICWSTSQNPTITDSHIASGSGLGTFSVDMEGLSPNITYYVRAYAINGVGVAYGNEVTFTTETVLAVVITNDVTDIDKTTATGNGEVISDGGANVTERGICWSTSHNPTIGDTHVASGSGLGTFDAAITDLTPHTIYYVRAYATNSVGTSYGEVKQFVTMFDAPDGTTGGLFSVAADKQVYFSNGNLQYQASTGVWRFADHQWDYLGNNNANVSPTYSGWIDLMGWGTGNNPTNSSDNDADYASFIDWGVNPISNGGNAANMWRTLKNAEWEYLLNTRATTTGIRYAKATVNGVPGVIIIPDEWNTDYYSLYSTNVSGAAFTVNTITDVEWESVFNVHGAMFLPAAGDRSGTLVEGAGEYGLYWSSSSGGNDYAYNMGFDEVAVITGYFNRHCGRSVRLVVPVMEVLTLDASDVDASSATLNGKIYCKDLDAVTSLGFVYGTDANNLDNNVAATTIDHSFSVSISNLEPGTSYYYKAHAVSGGNDYYGNLVAFTTDAVIAEVVTNDVTDIGTTSATGNGEVVSDGGSEVTERGICWSTSQNPTINDSYMASGTGVGTFSAAMTSLSLNTTYYVRAYAINGVGIAYGNQVIFTTGALLAEVITNDVTQISSNTATGNGEVVSDGGMTVTERGICWSTSQNPTIAGDHAASGSGLGTFSAAITGLAPNTTYYVRAYATNGVGTAYGNEVSFTTEATLAEIITNDVTQIGSNTATGNGEVVSDGGMTVTERGICWSTSQNPTIAGDHAASGTGLGTFSAAITGLSPNTTYYVRAYATNGVGTSYGNQVTFTTEAVLAEVITNDVTQISSNTATGNGEVVSDGGMSVTERGICWSTSQNPTIAGDHAAGGTGLGTFSAAITGLSPNTTYYVRAYATNCVGTSYGNQMTFTTEAVLAEVITNDVTEIGFSTATGNGEVVSDGGMTVTERGICWSTSQNPTIAGDHTTSGTGLGTFSAAMTGLQPHTSYYVRAYATNSVGTSYGEEKQFTTESAGPEGSTGGLFSVTADKQVYFSQGNLQYQASTDTWRFAEHQWDTIGALNANISSTYTGWIDLFGWGTGSNPTNVSTYDSDYPTFTEWGVNPISNGGNTAIQWRTLSSDEWSFLIFNRTTNSGILFAIATVNSVAGVIILPDDWSASYYTLNSINTPDALYTSNSITLEDWMNNLEAHGAMFLPAAGWRGGTSADLVGTYGFYWSSSSYESDRAYGLNFGGNGYYINMDSDSRNYGRSVRLACPIMEVVTTAATDVEVESATLNANVYCTDLSAITSYGFVYGTTATNLTSTVTATANGHSFSATASGLSGGTTYYYKAFVTTADGTYYGEVMQFETLPDAPEGSTGSLFSVSADKQVYFSNGNLQYQASTNTWRFADNQWECVGDNNSNISSTYTGWIDLFGWGTGNNPTNASTTASDYSTFADWGVNPISNGGNTADMWRTLTNAEWKYLMNTRTTTSGARYAKATVNGIAGLIVLPDDWSASYYTLSSTNTANAAFTANTVSSSDWANSFEAHGAVFLPAAGSRNGTSVSNVGVSGQCWSSTPTGSSYSYYLYFYGSGLAFNGSNNNFSKSVRLACPTMEVVTTEATNVKTTTAKLNGKFYCKDASSITARGFVYGTSATNLTSTVTATANGHSFSATASGLAGNTTYYYKAFATTADGTYYGEVMQFETTFEGSIGSVFSVAADKKVYFSQGNLQYRASPNIWRFASNHWDYVGNNNSNIS